MAPHNLTLIIYCAGALKADVSYLTAGNEKGAVTDRSISVGHVISANNLVQISERSVFSANEVSFLNTTVTTLQMSVARTAVGVLCRNSV